ncbi:MAG: protein TolQ [Betaproteobacteria bacterium]|jgi:biopolymer transport protein TolQ
MNVSTDLSILHLLTTASLTVQLVMLLLLALSLLSWLFIFQKLVVVRRARIETEAFELELREVHEDNELQRLLSRTSVNENRSSSIERILLAGYRENTRLRRQPGQASAGSMDGVGRAMRATYQREMDRIEASLNFLATVGSVSPYIGLFGTVWGIMNSFRGLANVGQATLATVAPGIAEALIATAIGLLAAIPAVIAYNHFSRDVDRLANRFESLMEEFQNLLLRLPKA